MATRRYPSNPFAIALHSSCDAEMPTQVIQEMPNPGLVNKYREKPKRPRELPLVLTLGILAVLTSVVGSYVSYLVQVPAVVAVEGRTLGQAGFLEDLATLRAVHDVVVDRLFSVFLPLSALWLGVLALVFFGRGWARILATVMAGPWMLATVLLWAWSTGRGGMPGVAIMLLPEARGYHPPEGVVRYATVQCGVTFALLTAVVVCLFVPATNRHMRVVSMFRRSRSRASQSRSWS